MAEEQVRKALRLIQDRVYLRFSSGSSQQYFRILECQSQLPVADKIKVLELIEHCQKKIGSQLYPKPNLKKQPEPTPVSEAQASRVFRQVDLKSLRKQAEERRRRLQALKQQMLQRQKLQFEQEIKSGEFEKQRVKQLSKRKILRIQTERSQRKQKQQQQKLRIQLQNKELQKKLSSLKVKPHSKYSPDAEVRSRAREHSPSFLEQVRKFQQKYLKLKYEKKTQAKQRSFEEPAQAYYKGRLHVLLQKIEEEQAEAQRRKQLQRQQSRVNAKVLAERLRKPRAPGERAKTTQRDKSQIQSVESVNYRTRLNTLGEKYMKLGSIHAKKSNQDKEAPLPPALKQVRINYLQHRTQSLGGLKRVRLKSLDSLGVQRFLRETQAVEEQAVRLEELGKLGRLGRQGEQQSRRVSQLLIGTIKSKLEVLDRLTYCTK